MKKDEAIVRVPATTANLGPGFDCLGVALQLYNRIFVCRENELQESHSPMVEESAGLFFKRTRKRFPFSLKITGRVPRSRGLGSSVTVRAGIIVALNHLAGDLLTLAECLNLVVDLEGHPDNAAPAFLGGFAACSDDIVFREPVDPKLKFITVIPEIEIQTNKARQALPEKILLADAVHNIRNSSIITAAFASHQYALLENAFQDRLHQPYRKKLIPQFDRVLEAATKKGALGAFLSGSGSTLMALSLGNKKECAAIQSAMCRPLQQAGISTSTMILSADNKGIQFVE